MFSIHNVKGRNMKRIITICNSTVFCLLCVLFTACPGGDDGDDSQPNPPALVDNTNGGNTGGDNTGNNNNGGSNNGGNTSDRGSISYTIDGKSFKTVLVEGGPMGDFYIMQTEMLPGDHNFVIEGVDFQLDKNHNNIISELEMYTMLSNLREKTGLPWRLPTRDEWKYAAKGGKKSSGYSYCGSNLIDDVAWYSSNSSNKPHEVAKKNPNELGLYDMSGNFAELCFNDTETNPVDGKSELDRECNPDGDFYGGCWNDPASECTPSSFKKGIVTGKVYPTSKVNEKGAFNGDYITVRLVYSK